jgi:hypothetical protein
VSGFLPAEIGRTARARIQEDRLEDRSSIPQALNFPSTRLPPAVCAHPHGSAGAYRIAGIAGITYSALARMPGQRAVNVLRRVRKRTPSMPCTAMSPNNERFSRQNCGTLSELRWARAPNASRRAAFAAHHRLWRRWLSAQLRQRQVSRHQNAPSKIKSKPPRLFKTCSLVEDFF